MRFSWTLVALIVLVAIRIVLTRLRRKRNSPSDQQPTKRDAKPDTYSGLRNLILQGSRQKFGLPPASPAEPYGVLMDWGVSSGTASVVAMADGTASIYFSSGGGYLGGGQKHESIKAAAKKTVEAAVEVLPLLHPTTTFPLPKAGTATFYVLTDGGVLTATATDDELRLQTGPFLRLGNAAQSIISQYRVLEKKK